MKIFNRKIFIISAAFGIIVFIASMQKSNIISSFIDGAMCFVLWYLIICFVYWITKKFAGGKK